MILSFRPKAIIYTDPAPKLKLQTAFVSVAVLESWLACAWDFGFSEKVEFRAFR
jgi:hypothetical protein